MVLEARAENISLERASRAVEEVRDRLRRTVAALEAAQVPYAMVGGNATQAWVASVDQDAMRITKDIDILLRRKDLPAACSAMEAAGFVYQEVAGVHMFLDRPDGTPRRAVHIVFAAEKVRPEYRLMAPDVGESVNVTVPDAFRVVTLEALVRMKLTSYRLRDKMHIIDMLDVGLIDETWCDRLIPPLADRLREMIAEWHGEQLPESGPSAH